MSTPPVLARMLRKLERRALLAESDRQALLGLPFRTQTIDRHAYMVREGEQLERSCLILSGFAYRQKVTNGGTRQILSVHMPGDMIDLEGSLLNISDHNVQALTRCEIATFSRADMRALLRAHPGLALALWVDTLIDGSIFREWILNVGRRDARGRIAHLLCEFAVRMQMAGLGERDCYELPMTQEQIGDAAGLTPVHVNRVLRDLGRSGLIERRNRMVAIRDWDGLQRAADFSALYLHLDQADRERQRAA